MKQVKIITSVNKVVLEDKLTKFMNVHTVLSVHYDVSMAGHSVLVVYED